MNKQQIKDIAILYNSILIRNNQGFDFDNESRIGRELIGDIDFAILEHGDSLLSKLEKKYVIKSYPTTPKEVVDVILNKKRIK